MLRSLPPDAVLIDGFVCGPKGSYGDRPVIAPDGHRSCRIIPHHMVHCSRTMVCHVAAQLHGHGKMAPVRAHQGTRIAGWPFYQSRIPRHKHTCATQEDNMSWSQLMQSIHARIDAAPWALPWGRYWHAESDGYWD